MKLRLAFSFIILLGFFLSTPAHAVIEDGVIDPYEDGNYLVHFLQTPDTGNASTDTRINFGKFTTADDYNIRITDDGFTGFAWSALAGYIVMSCESTTSGCIEANGRFEVEVDRNGKLSGFAWGENTGWINFGPFENNDAPQVQISETGYFAGVDGDIGYAWSENYGWIKFDCTVKTDCLRTDYRPIRYRSDNLTSTLPQCSNNQDDDDDGLTDGEDPGCSNGGNSEYANPFVPIGPTEPVNPTLPGTPPSTPTIPGTPSVPGTITPTEGTSEPESVTPVIPIITPIINTVTDVITIELPEARDRMVEFLRHAIEWLQELFDTMNRALAELMTNPFVQIILVSLTVI